MSRTILGACTALVVLIWALPGSVFAQPAYTADQVIGVFAPLIEPRTRGIGAVPDRGVCVGTEPECPSKPFDLIVQFEYDSAVLSEQAKRNLDEFAQALKSSQLVQATFSIDGHTDATGSETYNMGLSLRRAESVVRYLQTHGIESRRLAAKGFGESKPLPGRDPFEAANRRVEARLLLTDRRS
ncbi:OmpA family protein [Microvirga massiliensis]|uniref:OmpA family protein n=1 Tax=Microvirga massiliensis TaxID=1033741 RepID=UPI0006608A8A|nr:OmpA family protein [Microvirga massiliensis]